MWEVKGESVETDRLGSFSPIEVLSQYDFPRMFTFKEKAGELLLAFWCCEHDETDRFVVVPCPREVLIRLKNGNLPVRSALDQPDVCIIDIHVNGIQGAWKVLGLSAIPNRLLPANDVKLQG